MLQSMGLQRVGHDLVTTITSGVSWELSQQVALGGGVCWWVGWRGTPWVILRRPLQRTAGARPLRTVLIL